MVAALTYYALLATFPLVLLLVTVLGIVLADNPSLQERILASTVADLPIIGSSLQDNLGTLPINGPLAIVGLLTLIWGSLAVGRSGQEAMADLWDLPVTDRPGFTGSLARSGAVVSVIGLAGLANGTFSVLAADRHWPWWSVAVALLVIDLLAAPAVFRIVTPSAVPTRALLAGALISAVVWTLLLLAGGSLISAQLTRSTELYGFFGLVLGFILWLSVGMQASLLAAIANVVLARDQRPVSGG